jgi:hypothetical protein
MSESVEAQLLVWDEKSSTLESTGIQLLFWG